MQLQALQIDLVHLPPPPFFVIFNLWHCVVEEGNVQTRLLCTAVRSKQKQSCQKWMAPRENVKNRKECDFFLHLMFLLMCHFFFLFSFPPGRVETLRLIYAASEEYILDLSQSYIASVFHDIQPQIYFVFELHLSFFYIFFFVFTLSMSVSCHVLS